MAETIEFFDNFPVKFNSTDNECDICDDRPFCQLAQWGDLIGFFFKGGTLDVEVINPDFETDLSDWTVGGAGTGWTWAAAGRARLTNSVDPLSQNFTTNAGKYYKISFTVFNSDASGTLNVEFDNTSVINNISNGIHVLYINTSLSSTDLEFSPQSADFTLDIDDVTIEEVRNDYLISIYDTVNILYSSSLPVTTTIGTDRQLRFDSNWNAFGFNTDGCYKIVIIDPVNNTGNVLLNPNFDDSTAWTQGTNWNITGGKAVYDYVSGGLGSLSQSISGLTSIGILYTLRFTVSSFSGANMTVSITNSNLSVIINANGTYNIPFVRTGGSSGLEFLKPTSGGHVELDNVYIFENTEANGIYLSECYKLATSHECTKLLKWSNNKNAFGVLYGISLSYFNYLRTEAKILNSRHNSDKNNYDDSDGDDILYYANSKKKKELRVGALPEYLHDAIAIGLIHTNFYIDNSRYAWQDSEYAPEWDSKLALKLSESRTLISEYTQRKINID